MEATGATPPIEELVELVRLTEECGQTPLEPASERLSALVRRYCECPQLLEPHLPILLKPLLARCRSDSQLAERRAALLFIYHIMRARGYKRAVCHLPHEISDLRPVLEFLENERPDDRENWPSRFVLLLWLSMIVMMPFHMSRLDAFTEADRDENRKTVMKRIFDICKTYSLVTDACSEAGAFLTSKFLTRSDVIEVHLGEFFEWSRRQNGDLREEDDINYGVLASVATVLKHGKREDLLRYAEDLFHWIVRQNYQNSKAILVRKYGIKIVQRIGLVLLKPRSATWRYIRETSSLALNLQAAGDGKAVGVDQNFIGSPNIEDETIGDDQDIPEQIEDIMEHLILGLRDGDNVVRWSAAKGIGRVAARLNCSAAGDIISGIMDLFNPHEGDGAWHGGCLALAELGRRGLLLKSHLRNAVCVVLPALQYEEVRGHTPTGRHVRDAACYVCWAFVRAYTNDLIPYINELLVGLMITAVFDREINCRLAARAAFEESVGRLQVINPENLILLTSDQFYLSSRKKAFLVAAPYAASVNNKYTKPLIDHLLEKKIQHWDINIRELASKSLHILTKENPSYMSETILPRLLEASSSNDLNTRHGSILAIGEVFYGLYLNGVTKISDEVFEGVRNIIPTLNSKYQFRGLGGELMRQACCSYIENLSLSKTKYHGMDIINDWLALVEECLSHEVNVIRTKAVSALAAIFNEYLNDDYFKSPQNGIGNAESFKIELNQKDAKSLSEKRITLINQYCLQLKSVSVNGIYTRMGYALSIGCLPKFALEDSLLNIISSLIECTRITETTLKWAESRRDALIGLTNVCKTVGIDQIEKLKANSNTGINVVFECFLSCLTEYTIEMRGDIGAWVREASIAGLAALCKQCAEENLSSFTPELVTKIMVGIAQQSVEKIDRTRAHGGKVFTNLLYSKPTMPFIPHHKELISLFPYVLDNSDNDCSANGNLEKSVQGSLNLEDEESQCKPTVLWLFAEHTMPLFVKLLDWEVYRYNIILGLTISAGDMTESLVKHSTSALFAYLISLHDNYDQLLAVCNTIVQVFSDHHDVDRVMIPMLKFLDRLLSSGTISSILDDKSCTFAEDILKHVKIELDSCKNVYKLLDAISVLCQILQVGGNICGKALGKLVIYLCRMDKYVRKATATKLYDALLIYGDATSIPEENLDQVMALLADTNWELEVAILKPIRNDLCTLMDIPQPIPIKRKIIGP